MKSQVWRWVLGLVYIFLVAAIWIASSYVVQSIVDEGVPPFLLTYICNSLFVVYIPLVEIAHYLEDKHGSLLFWRKKKHTVSQDSRASEQAIVIDINNEVGPLTNVSNPEQEENVNHPEGEFPQEASIAGSSDAKGRWRRKRVAKASLLICPFWFLAQLTFNLSLKYTTVTSTTILSSSSSLFTFLVALVFLREKFTWLKLIRVVLCVGGSIIVSLGGSGAESSSRASKPVLGDILALVSAALYAAYTTLIRQKMGSPDEDDDKTQGHASMAQFLGFLGLFNLLIFLPVAVVLEFTKLESISSLTGKEIVLIVGKGMLDNVLSDYLWAKVVLLTTTTAATAGLTIQVPLAAIVDSITGNAPHLLDYIGGGAVLVGFTGINIPPGALFKTKRVDLELESRNMNTDDHTDV